MPVNRLENFSIWGIFDSVPTIVGGGFVHYGKKDIIGRATRIERVGDDLMVTWEFIKSCDVIHIPEHVSLELRDGCGPDNSGHDWQISSFTAFVLLTGMS